MKKSRNAKTVRRENRSLILELLHSYSPISRSELSELSGLTKATVTNVINEFLSVGLVEEFGTKDTPVGRKRKLLKIKPDAFYVVGVDISRDRVRAGVFNTAAEILSIEEERIDGSGNKEELLSVIFSVLERSIMCSGVPREKIHGIGVGIPGPLDYERGVVISPPRFKGLTNTPLKEILEDRFGITTWIDNDANVAAMGEKWFGKGKTLRNFVFVIADIGLGCGIVVERKLYRGSLKGTGEIGHVPLVMDRDMVELEELASLSNLPAIFQELTGEERGIDEILKMAKEDRREALEAFREIGKYVSVGVGTIVNVLGPEVVFMGGRFAEVSENLEIVRKRVEGFSFLPENPSIEATELGDRAILLGAGALALEEIVSNPYTTLLKGKPL